MSVLFVKKNRTFLIFFAFFIFFLCSNDLLSWIGADGRAPTSTIGRHGSVATSGLAQAGGVRGGREARCAHAAIGEGGRPA